MLRRYQIYHKGIVITYKASQRSTLYLPFSTTTKTTKPKKEIKLTDEPPTAFPPINPKLWDYEAQKGPQRHKAQSKVHTAINVPALFLFAGVLCGGIISFFQPKDFRNDFKFHSPLPDAKYSKLDSDEPLNIQQTLDIKNNIQRDQASAMTYSLCLGFTGGIMGSFWYRNMTHPLRIKKLSLFELNETLNVLRTHSFRNCIKGTLFGCFGVLGIIYSSVFIGYLYFGEFFKNKYVDKSFWKYVEILYQRNIESRRLYEINLELQEHLKKEKEITPLITPSLEGEKELNEIRDKRYDEQKVIEEEQIRKRALYKKAIKGMEWNTDLYLRTKDLPYHKLSEEQKNVRWNMAREMATLSLSCALYIVLPIYLGTSVFATRIYSKYWKQMSQQIIKTKQMPTSLY